MKLDEVTSYYEKDLADNEGLRDHIIRGLRNSELPQQWPAFHHLKINDENLVWLSTIANDQKVYEWWVTDAEGQLMARFTWPRDRKIKKIANGYVYALETEESMGLQEVVRYRVSFDM